MKRLATALVTAAGLLALAGCHKNAVNNTAPIDNGPDVYNVAPDSLGGNDMDMGNDMGAGNATGAGNAMGAGNASTSNASTSHNASSNASTSNSSHAARNSH